MSNLPAAISSDIAAIQAISAVPTILEAVAALTGMRFICVARVTKDSWTTCAVLDRLGFGLGVGDGLDVKTTICDEIRDSGCAVVIDHVSEDAQYRDHHTPRMYGFQSYISIPIFRPDGAYFGTLCALDPAPAKVSEPATRNSIELFAQLISHQLANESHLAEANAALLDERETAELREQFIAVLGHDLRNPLGSIISGAELLLMMQEVSTRGKTVVERMLRSANRIAGLVDDVLDFTRGRMGGGITLNIRHEKSLGDMLLQVVAELQDVYPTRSIEARIGANLALFCDGGRMAQLLSNLLKNAIVHGSPHFPVEVTASLEQGLFRLSVANHGVAIPEATRAQLFKPFWRGAPTAANEGLGLGLFIVSEIARSHGGRIEVKSDEHMTTFVFTLKTADYVDGTARLA